MYVSASKGFNDKLHIFNYNKKQSLPASSYVLIALHYFLFNLLRVEKTLKGLNPRLLIKRSSWSGNFFAELGGHYRSLAIKFDPLPLRSRRFSRLAVLDLVYLLSQVIRLVSSVTNLVLPSGRSLCS